MRILELDIKICLCFLKQTFSIIRVDTYVCTSVRVTDKSLGWNCSIDFRFSGILSLIVWYLVESEATL